MDAEGNAPLPTTIVIFGGTGDLARTKLFPALLDLFMRNMLPEAFVVIGLSRKKLSREEYQQFVRECIDAVGHEHDEAVVHSFLSAFRYIEGDFNERAVYEDIKTALKDADETHGTCANKLFHLAVPPQYYDTIFTYLAQSEALALCDGKNSWARLLVEKPFGKDLKTAQALEARLSTLFKDQQVYRIDHYLAKDAIENILSIRFANGILADSWCREAIESIEIRMLETKDVSNRGSFYDGLGTLRDVGQNHMLQMYALLTMDAANVKDPSEMRSARAAALQALANEVISEVTRGQYVGYQDTEGVANDSDTETYFAFSVTADDGPWKGTQFSFEAGKALHTEMSEAVITFRPVDTCSCAGDAAPHEHKNVLRIQFAPTQEIALTLSVKEPGFTFRLKEQTLVLVRDEVVLSHTPEAYERVLYDCIVGDQTRFVSGAEVEAAWRFITPILEQFKTVPLVRYEKGSEGPAHNITTNDT